MVPIFILGFKSYRPLPHHEGNRATRALVIMGALVIYTIALLPDCHSRPLQLVSGRERDESQLSEQVCAAILVVLQGRRQIAGFP